MVFNSIVFVVFFILFFFIYWFINNRFSLNSVNLFILAASYFFYGWWDWRFLGLIAFTSALDFYVGQWLFKSKDERLRKGVLIISICINLGILGFFKYFNFFAHSLTLLLERFSVHPGFVTLNIVLPVGVSFYTFQSMSYAIDIYRRRLEPRGNMLSFFSFVAFFPQLVAGPIERAKNLLPQFNYTKTIDAASLVGGLRLMLWGFFKKIVIADNMAVITDEVFGNSNSYHGITIAAGIICFALQIYGDFSGYSDIATGTARMLGFQLCANFKTPYFARSVTEFWRRWHISLSSWFKDYVYIPMGGNRSKPLRYSMSILTTFILSGLWHGANFTFLVWGTLHGLAVIIEKVFAKQGLFHRAIYPVLSIIFVIFLWLPFRAESISHARQLCSQLLHVDMGTKPLAELFTEQLSAIKSVLLAATTVLMLLVERKMGNDDFNHFVERIKKPYRMGLYYLLILLLAAMSNFDVKPYFIYFQF